LRQVGQHKMALPKSIVLITVDCLRADHCGFMGYPLPTTPFLDGLAGESFVFPAAIAAGVPTYYSLPAIMASRYPLAVGREVLGLAPEEKTLASTLKENGYATAFFGAGNPYLSARLGFDSGFDTFRDFLERSPSSPNSGPKMLQSSGWVGSVNRILADASRNIPGIRTAYDELYFQYCQRQAVPVPSFDALRRFPAADVIVDQARTWLVSIGSGPFFLWLHLMDPHAPYYPTDEALSLFASNSITASRARYLNAYWNRLDVGTKRLRRYRDEVIGMYDSGIRWVDAQLSRLVEILRQSKLWENCIFACTSDHGEEFLEHDRRYHAPALVEELIHVPLLLRVPGLRKTPISTSPFSLLDLAPTLLAAIELPIPEEFQGRSRWKDLQEGTSWSDPAIAECIARCTNPYSPEQRRGARLLAVRESRYKLVMKFDAGFEQLFDLETDPEERRPLPSAAAKPERRRLLEAGLAHLRRSSDRESSRCYLRARVREINFNFQEAAKSTSLSATG
jgi:arylsulfatase A-like enzyme